MEPPKDFVPRADGIVVVECPLHGLFHFGPKMDLTPVSTETVDEEHDRLQRRTGELKREHAALSRGLTPFDQADHDLHNENLRKHRADLGEHKRRAENERPVRQLPPHLAELDAFSKALESELAAFEAELDRIEGLPQDHPDVAVYAATVTDYARRAIEFAQRVQRLLDAENSN
jgi:chromosome segregation ATPase